MNFLNLTLERKEDNILRDIECIEKIDTFKLYKLLITSNVLKTDLRYKNVYENEKDQLINYLTNSIDDNNIKVKYVKDFFGRSLPQYSYGLHNIRREVRYTISKDYYEDIDMSHPFGKGLKDRIPLGGYEVKKISANQFHLCGKQSDQPRLVLTNLLLSSCRSIARCVRRLDRSSWCICSGKQHRH